MVTNKVEKISISLPITLVSYIDTIKKKNKIGRSEFIRQAVELYRAERTKDELRKIASTMREEYKSNKNLTVFKGIEHEDFVE
jgi:metal-responsive CopG/Arc/MetJ family transcriptional regulator